MIDVIGSLPAAGALGAGAVTALKSPELLKEIYGDLAKPGVAQVGKAIGGILGLGNTILLPLRLLNEAGRAFEQRSFAQIASRFKDIPEEKIVSPPPEVSVPILDKLSHTRDNTLRELFIELLAQASQADTAGKVHPSFVQVIGSIAPEEAVLLKSFKFEKSKPVIAAIAVSPDLSKGRRTLRDLILLPPAVIKNRENIPLFISNLVGLGVLELIRDRYLVGEGRYNNTTEYAKTHFGIPDEVEIKGEMHKVEYQQFICAVSPYGDRLLEACS